MRRYAVSALIMLLTLVFLLTFLRSQDGLTAGALTCDPQRLQHVTVDPARPHRVAGESWTSHVLRVVNPGVNPVSVLLSAPLVPDWTITLAPADANFQPAAPAARTLPLQLAAQGQATVVVLTRPSAAVPEGATIAPTVWATFGDGGLGCRQLGAQVDHQPKILLIGVDGLSPDYLNLGRDGAANPVPGNELTPVLRGFTQDAAWFPEARASLPSATDPNVFAALSGSWPGTAGITYVGYYFYGWTEGGTPILGPISRSKIRYGAEGLPVRSVFDIAQDPAAGGDPGRFTALISGKNQIDHLFRDGPVAALDLLADGQLRPTYLSVPQPYVLGDPDSDDNAATDRDGVNLLPADEYRLHPAGFGLAGEQPLENPSDAWIGQSALRLLAAEDPDVLYVHLGGVDKVHHAAGAADQPSEWLDPGTPSVLWDDVSRVNRYANREPVLDVVHEADRVIGSLLQALQERGAYDRTLITIWSDHSEWTYLNVELDTQAILTAHGLGDAGRRLASWQEIGYLFLTDPALAPQVESVLETYTVTHPLTGQAVNPFLVLNPAEMDSGMDGATGRFGRDGGPGRGELYSEWLIEYPAPDNSKVIWPDLLILSRYRFQLKNFRPQHLDRVLGGHAGTATLPVLFALRGPGIIPGTFAGIDTSLVDLMPTLYQLLGWTPPASVDGRLLDEILDPD